MSFLSRGLFVVAGIIVGTTAINYMVLGNSADYGLPNSRLGLWRDANVRPACYGADDTAESRTLGMKVPAEQHRVKLDDFTRARELTARLHCYIILQRHAACEPNNRAYIVDYIGKYFDKFDSMIKTASGYGPDEVRLVRLMWDSSRNREISAALEAHIRNGWLTKSDFGWSAPAALKDHFERYRGVPDTCGSQQAWLPVKT